MTNLNTNLFPAILDACKRLPSAYLGVRLLDETQLCLLFDGGFATYGDRGDKKEMPTDTILKEMERTVADCIANGQGVLITARDEAHDKAYSVFYYDGDIILNPKTSLSPDKPRQATDISDLLRMEPALDLAKAPWSDRLETVRRNMIPAVPYIPQPISFTREYLSRLELSIHKRWQSGQRILIPDVIACGVVFADVLTVAFGCEWDYSKIGCEDIALRIGKARIHPFLRVKKFVLDSEWTLTSIWDWLDTRFTNIAKEGEEHMYRVSASSPETLDRLRQQLGAVEDNSEAGVLELLLRMSDEELQRMNGNRIKNVKHFREFLRRKKLKKHPR